MIGKFRNISVAVILTIVSPLYSHAEPLEISPQELIVRYERPSAKTEPTGKALESEWADVTAKLLTQIGLAQEAVASISPLHKRVSDYARQRDLRENEAILALIGELKTPSTRLAKSDLLTKVNNKSPVYNLTTALVITFSRAVDIGGAVAKLSALSPASLKAAGLSDFRVRASGAQTLQYASYEVEKDDPAVIDSDPVCDPSPAGRIAILDLGFSKEGSLTPAERYSLSHSASASCFTGAQSERALRGAFTHGIVKRICPKCETIAIEAGCARKDITSVSVVDLAEALVLAAIRDSSTMLLPLATSNARIATNLSDEFAFVRDADVAVVAAAGDFASTDKHYPAAQDGVLGVGALTSSGKPTALSNTGSWVSASVLGVRQRALYGQNERRLVSGTSAAMATVGARVALFRASEGGKKAADLAQAAKGGFFGQSNTIQCKRQPADSSATADTSPMQGAPNNSTAPVVVTSNPGTSPGGSNAPGSDSLGGSAATGGGNTISPQQGNPEAVVFPPRFSERLEYTSRDSVAPCPREGQGYESTPDGCRFTGRSGRNYTFFTTAYGAVALTARNDIVGSGGFGGSHVNPSEVATLVAGPGAKLDILRAPCSSKELVCCDDGCQIGGGRGGGNSSTLSGVGCYKDANDPRLKLCLPGGAFQLSASFCKKLNSALSTQVVSVKERCDAIPFGPYRLPTEEEWKRYLEDGGSINGILANFDQSGSSSPDALPVAVWLQDQGGKSAKTSTELDGALKVATVCIRAPESTQPSLLKGVLKVEREPFEGATKIRNAAGSFERVGQSLAIYRMDRPIADAKVSAVFNFEEVVGLGFQTGYNKSGALVQRWNRNGDDESYYEAGVYFSTLEKAFRVQIARVKGGERTTLTSNMLRYPFDATSKVVNSDCLSGGLESISPECAALRAESPFLDLQQRIGCPGLRTEGKVSPLASLTVRQVCNGDVGVGTLPFNLVKQCKALGFEIVGVSPSLNRCDLRTRQSARRSGRNDKDINSVSPAEVQSCIARAEKQERMVTPINQALLTFTTAGDSLKLYLNDKLVAEARDSALSEGLPGVALTRTTINGTRSLDKFFPFREFYLFSAIEGRFDGPQIGNYMGHRNRESNFDASYLYDTAFPVSYERNPKPPPTTTTVGGFRGSNIGAKVIQLPPSFNELVISNSRAPIGFSRDEMPKVEPDRQLPARDSRIVAGSFSIGNTGNIAEVPREVGPSASRVNIARAMIKNGQTGAVIRETSLIFLADRVVNDLQLGNFGTISEDGNTISFAAGPVSPAIEWKKLRDVPVIDKVVDNSKNTLRGANFAGFALFSHDTGSYSFRAQGHQAIAGRDAPGLLSFGPDVGFVVWPGSKVAKFVLTPDMSLPADTLVATVRVREVLTGRQVAARHVYQRDIPNEKNGAVTLPFESSGTDILGGNLYAFDIYWYGVGQLTHQSTRVEAAMPPKSP